MPIATPYVPQVFEPNCSFLGGAMMFRVFQFSSRLVLLVLALAFIRTADAQKQPTRNPHGPLAIPCENCHTSTSWIPIRAIPEFNHDSTRYPLRGMHEKVSCTQCHIKPVFTDVGKNCADCHADIHRRQMGANCVQCHTVSGWNVSVQAIQNHFNRFPLLGAHAVVQCDECHKSAAVGQFQGLSTVCLSCHQADFQKTASIGGSVPNHLISKGFSQPCETCHSFDTWANAKFDHSQTGFPLQGLHAQAACTSCHVNNNYNLAGIAVNDCQNSGCHLTTWQQTTNPAHASAPTFFPIAQCSTCHTVNGWTGAPFDHSVTGFPLTNGHANVACTSCHVNNNFTLTTALNDCGNSGCHLTTWNQTNNPVHRTAGTQFMAANCAVCHNTISWTTASFDHSATGFPLTNGHANVPCVSCHINNNYTLTTAPNDCGNSGCHLTTWQQTNNPVHSTAGSQFATSNCAVCHNTVSWTTTSFDHNATGFALTGTHMSPTPTPCASCHVSNNYLLKSADCYGCHQPDFQRTTTMGGNVPNHVTAGFPTTAAQCASCHPITTWAAGVFDHSTTGFPLTNSHATVACASCHTGNNYSLMIAPNDCGNSGCHLTTWNQTNNPVHSTAGSQFAASNCAVCHSTVSWTTAAFDHSSTGFALTGMHVSPSPTPCASCHLNNNYLLKSAACYGCHIVEWQSTATIGNNVPNHITAGFPQDCSICHSTLNWTGSTFNHSSTGFALTGLHVSPVPTPCISCHISNNYALTSAACYACHILAWQSTATIGGSVPNHIASGYPQSCESCHTTTSWLGAVFNHNATRFPLTGAHTTVACTLCHLTATPPPLDCYSCHTVAWQSTANLGGMVPNHLAADAAAALITTNCITCHNTTSWLGATFTHSWFNVNHGNAGGVCSACHLNTLGTAANYVLFQCTGCHGGNVAANFHHSNVTGYVYNSVVCYACHKNGGG
jgi:hypothetical protein